MYIVNKFKPFYRFLKKEDILQNTVVNYAEMQHQAVALPCNIEGRKTPFQRYLFTVMGGRKGTLDLFFPYARHNFNGLFIELKTEGTKVFKKDGMVRKDKTLSAQWEKIQHHIKQGYKAEFAIGFDEAKDILDYYFNKQ
tara:strand:+ start:442 stop:858 length:417 start_codon:yes stop_codon:yes gene_type:complete